VTAGPLQDNADVYCDLVGLDARELEALERAGVV
jgi:hypothetical protein